jgi:predicted RNA binding protein YcfA (HicA-like mRNA interferase family)
MPSLSDLPGDPSRRKFIKALKKLGFDIDMVGGDGSHCKATWPKTQKSVTIPYHFSKNVLYYVLKEINTISTVNWNDIKKFM